MIKLFFVIGTLFSISAFAQGIDEPNHDIGYESEQEMVVFTHDMILDAYLLAMEGSLIDDNLEICIAAQCKFYPISDRSEAVTTKVKAPKVGPKKILDVAKKSLKIAADMSNSLGARMEAGSIKISPDGTIEMTDVRFFIGSESISMPGFDEAMQKNHK